MAVGRGAEKRRAKRQAAVCGLPAPLCLADCAAVGAAPVLRGSGLPRVRACNTGIDVTIYASIHVSVGVECVYL